MRSMKKIHAFGDTIETLLFDAGLSEKEARIYRVLLDKGAMPASEVINLSGLKKGIIYTLLYKLVKEELVEQFEKEGKLYFQLREPQKLKDLVDRKKRTMEDVSSRVEKLLPSLQSKYKLVVGKPTIQYFEGEEGIKTIFEDIYGKKETDANVYGCVDLEKTDKVFPGYVLKKLIPKRIKNKVYAYSFVADSAQAREITKNDKKQLRTTVLVNKEEYRLPAEIDVYEDKIAMLSFEKNEFIGVLISNKAFADSLRSIFRLALGKKG